MAENSSIIPYVIEHMDTDSAQVKNYAPLDDIVSPMLTSVKTRVSSKSTNIDSQLFLHESFISRRNTLC